MTDDAPPDQDLLLRYRNSGCGEAFRVLVQRHAGMVCATAQRILGNDLWAQDVMQAVFVDFARKGRALPDSIVPGAWLYRAACRHALNRRRTEARHRRRMETHAAMNEPATADETWAALSPHLDAALLSLKHADRSALVLRFLENQPLAEVGGALGITEDAAQKRVSRALTRLRSLLEKRGVALSAAMLGSAALRQSAQAAAPSVACESLAATALSAGAGPVSFWTALACNARAALIAAGLGSLAGGAVWHSVRAAAASPAALPAKTMAGPSLRPGSVTAGGSAGRGAALLPVLREPATAQEALKAMQSILALPENYHRQVLTNWMLRQDLLTKLPLGELARLMDECGDHRVMRTFGSQVLNLYALAGDAADAKAATLMAMRQQFPGTLSVTGDCFQRWAQRDAAGAYEWLRDHPPDASSFPAPSEDERRPAWVVLACAPVDVVFEWSHGDPARAYQLASQIPERLRAELFQHELKMEHRYNHNTEEQLRKDLAAARECTDPAIREWMQRSMVRAALAATAKWGGNAEKLRQEISDQALPAALMPPAGELLVAQRAFSRPMANRFFDETNPQDRGAMAVSVVRTVIDKKWNSSKWREELNRWLDELPPETPGLDQARIILQRRIAQSSAYWLFKNPLPPMDPAFHDTAVAGWLQIAARNQDAAALRRFYEESEIARGWSPALRARAEEIIATAQP